MTKDLNHINEFKDSKGYYAWSRLCIMKDEPWEETRFLYYKYDLRKKSRIKINKEQYHLAYKNLN